MTLQGDWFRDGRLALPPGLSFEDWESIGQMLQAMEKHVQWWVGDWWRFGERHYGEAAAQAAPSGFALQTVRNAAWVAQAIEPSRRREDLPFSHHVEVASLEPDTQDELLQKAADNAWTRVELRAHVRSAQGKEPTMTECVCVNCGNSHFRRVDP